MIQRFKAILLREFHGFDPDTVIDVMAGGEGFAGRWIVLAPVELAGQWAAPSVDADAAITMIEAAVVLSVRRGWDVPASSVSRYIRKGILKNAGRPAGDQTQGSPLFVARQAVWTMAFPSRLRGRPNQQEESNE